MAEELKVTSSLKRNDLQKFLGNDQRAIKAFEDFSKTVAETIPDAVNVHTVEIVTAQDAADAAHAALAMLTDYLDTQRGMQARVQQLERRIASLESQLLTGRHK